VLVSTSTSGTSGGPHFFRTELSQAMQTFIPLEGPQLSQIFGRVRQTGKLTASDAAPAKVGFERVGVLRKSSPSDSTGSISSVRSFI